MAKKQSAKKSNPKVAKAKASKPARARVAKAAKKAKPKPVRKSKAKSVRKPAPRRDGAPRAKPARKAAVKPEAATPPSAPAAPVAAVETFAPAQAAPVQQPAAPGAIPGRLNDLILRSWPDQTIDFAKLNLAGSYLSGCVDALRAGLDQIEPGCFFYEREPIVSAEWMPDDVSDLPSEGDFPRSYHLFFLGPLGLQFEGPCETVMENEAGQPVTVHGKYRWGWTVGISCVAPVAVVVVDTISEYENAAIDYLELNLFFDEENARPSTDGAAMKNRLPQSAWDKLESMRNRITGLLHRHGIEVLSLDVLGLPIPTIKAGSDLLLDADELRVKDAFFFQSV